MAPSPEPTVVRVEITPFHAMEASDWEVRSHVTYPHEPDVVRSHVIANISWREVSWSPDWQLYLSVTPGVKTQTEANAICLAIQQAIEWKNGS